MERWQSARGSFWLKGYLACEVGQGQSPPPPPSRGLQRRERGREPHHLLMLFHSSGSRLWLGPARDRNEGRIGDCQGQAQVNSRVEFDPRTVKFPTSCP